MTNPLKSSKPEYRIQLPVSNKRCAYTTFTLGTELTLMQASQGGDMKEIITAMINCLNDHIRTDGIKAEDLPQAEAELLLINMRSKSAGSNVEVLVTDPQDPEKTYPAKIDLSKIVIEQAEDFSPNVELSDGRVVCMKIPSLTSSLDSVEANEDGEDDTITNLKLLAKSIKSVVVDDEAYAASDFSEEELLEFVKDLDVADGLKLTGYLDTLPAVKASVTIKRDDGTKFTEEVSGLASFL
jgi:hypothetical protein